MKTSLQILAVASLPSTLIAKWRWRFRPTRYITIFLRRIQGLQIFKIPKDVIHTLRNYIITWRLCAFSLVVNRALLEDTCFVLFFPIWRNEMSGSITGWSSLKTPSIRWNNNFYKWTKSQSPLLYIPVQKLVERMQISMSLLYFQTKSKCTWYLKS